ncbi:hypothetical protein [Propionicicella superfundia]|uniref:hypothetical protein n=1 Tax=Propionicicella superfundia TaxID=348582 RepID=UPI000412A958|nr:hypothetical protein [Propionicicella superfundia]
MSRSHRAWGWILLASLAVTVVGGGASYALGYVADERNLSDTPLPWLTGATLVGLLGVLVALSAWLGTRRST